MIGHETNPQPRECNAAGALHARTKELEQRELTQDDFEEAMHILTSRGFQELIATFGKRVMKAIASGSANDAEMVVCFIQGVMQHARFMDSMDKASKEIV